MDRKRNRPPRLDRRSGSARRRPFLKAEEENRIGVRRTCSFDNTREVPCRATAKREQRRVSEHCRILLDRRSSGSLYTSPHLISPPSPPVYPTLQQKRRT